MQYLLDGGAWCLRYALLRRQVACWLIAPVEWYGGGGRCSYSGCLLDHIMLMWGLTWKCFPKTKRNTIKYIWINFKLIYLFIYLFIVMLPFVALCCRSRSFIGFAFCNAMRCDEVQFFAFGSLIDWRKISAFINNNNFYSHFAAVVVVVFFAWVLCCGRRLWSMGRVGGCK